ncbi:MAG: SLBB domain-containing protein [Candidatus Aureabacteria bacterium]|nr:SLBB domain-containing protein [Candidatus Auribacterota bacterium]
MTGSLAELVKMAGVAGAGGAGFPTYVKLSARAEIVIANGAECEPLLRVDQQAMTVWAPELVRGMELAAEAVGAKRAVIALKRKYRGAVDALKAEIARRSSRVELFLMPSHYPAGDEQVLVFEATGRVVPEGGLPLAVGVVVNNVGTLINVFKASRGEPVTHRVLTVAGEVKRPVTLIVPIGAYVEDVLKAAGGAIVPDPVVLDGGPIMGVFSSGVVAKTTTGLIVLPSGHKLVEYKRRSLDVDVRKAAWACDGCRTCTDYCPRYLLGHRMEPHIIMRLVGQQRADAIPRTDLAKAYLCCQCGVCGMFACPTSLSPERVIAGLLKEFKRAKVEKIHRRSVLQPHPFRDGRRIPVSRFASRIDVSRYETEAPLKTAPLAVSRLRVPLKQHVGAPCRPLVRKGERVTAGQAIADVPDGAQGV